MPLPHCAGHPDGSNPKLASRWHKDAKQLVNAAQRLVLVGALRQQSVCGFHDQECSTAGVSRHILACGLTGCWNWLGAGAGRYPAPVIPLSYSIQRRVVIGRC